MNFVNQLSPKTLYWRPVFDKNLKKFIIQFVFTFYNIAKELLIEITTTSI